MRLRYLLLATATIVGIAAPAAAAAPPPPGATTGAVVSVKTNSAVVTGSVNPNGTATTWEFQYGLASSSSFPSSTPMKSAGSGTADVSESATLPGLSSATSYHYRIVAISSAGTSYGAAGILNTTAAPIALTNAASSVGVASAVLNGIVNPEGASTTWFFQYGTTTAYSSKTAAVTLAPTPNNTRVSTTLTGLIPHTTYHFRIVASNLNGSARGIDFAFTTGLPVTINASSASVVFGSAVTLSGAAATGTPGIEVTIESKRFDQSSPTGLAVVTTGSGGNWSYLAHPTARTSYDAVVAGVASSNVVVGVSPLVTIARLQSGALSTSVTASVSFGDHVLQLQRLSAGNWVTWKHVRLNARGSARFTTSLPVGRTLVRMAIGPTVQGIDQAAPGYLAGYSRPIAYVHH